MASTATEGIIGRSEHRTVDSLLDTFHQAAATSNLRNYFGCFHTDGRFLGTDATENWHVNDFLAFSQPYFLTTKCAWKYDPIAGTRKVTYFPNATNPQFCIFDELLTSESFVATSRGSGTLVFDATKQIWLIASYHLTFPIPNDIAKEMTAKIATFEQAQKSKESALAAQRLIEELELEEQNNKGKQQSNSNNKKKSKKK